MQNFTFTIRTFKAVDDPAACQKYIAGHSRILQVFGLSMITSANPTWVNDPDTHVITVESADGSRIYGGGRIQIASGRLPLPIQTAIGNKEPAIHEVIHRFAQKGTGEICGLWNAREMAANGIGSLHLGRAIVAVAGQLNLTSLFALCAPATVKNCLQVGFEVAGFLGRGGQLIYPKDHLLATAMLIRDLQQLPAASARDREIIADLRNKPSQERTEPGIKGHLLTISYQLNADPVPAYCVA